RVVPPSLGCATSASRPAGVGRWAPGRRPARPPGNGPRRRARSRDARASSPRAGRAGRAEGAWSTQMVLGGGREGPYRRHPDGGLVPGNETDISYGDAGAGGGVEGGQRGEDGGAGGHRGGCGRRPATGGPGSGLRTPPLRRRDVAPRDGAARCDR